MMIHVKGLYRDRVRRDEQVSIPEGAHGTSPEEENPWKSGGPVTEQDLEGFLSTGM